MTRTALLCFALIATPALAAEDADREAVTRLDTEYQAAVKRNDGPAMARILDDRFMLVLGNGKTFTKKEVAGWAEQQTVVYEKQDEEPGTRTVRVYGDTAIVTALLWLKGTRGGQPIDQRLWFSDTYVRTPAGWKYVFGQASLPLPPK